MTLKKILVVKKHLQLNISASMSSFLGKEEEIKALIAFEKSNAHHVTTHCRRESVRGGEKEVKVSPFSSKCEALLS